MKNLHIVQEELPYCGISSDTTLCIYDGMELAAVAYLNEGMDKETYFLEWIEEMEEYQHTHIFREVLIAVMEYLHCNVMKFDCTNELLPMYEHIGSDFVMHDDFRNMNEMTISYNKLFV